MEKGNNEVVARKEMRGGGGGGKAVGVPLRVLALLLTLGAAAVLGLDKQHKMVGASFGTITLNVSVIAKFSYVSAFSYFVVVNTIASAFAALSVILLLANKGVKAGRLALLTVLGDIIMVALLFSGNGATMAIGLMAKKGNSRLHWKEICSVFGKFCNFALVAVGLSLLGSVVYLLLAYITICHLHKRYYCN
ncbi:hypothetical protein Ancab_030533 [Ancistrocladus abbreviatus]